jgi:heme-degrading monooxygenase HmoA
MFVNIVHFPKIKEGKDMEFRQWFEDSNRAYAKHNGFIRRVLLQPRDGGNSTIPWADPRSQASI